MVQGGVLCPLNARYTCKVIMNLDYSLCKFCSTWGITLDSYQILAIIVSYQFLAISCYLWLSFKIECMKTRMEACNANLVELEVLV